MKFIKIVNVCVNVVVWDIMVIFIIFFIEDVFVEYIMILF